MKNTLKTYDIELLKKLKGEMKSVDFAKSLGISKQQYYNIENGFGMPIHIVKKLDDMFNLSAEQICKLIGLR